MYHHVHIGCYHFKDHARFNPGPGLLDPPKLQTVMELLPACTHMARAPPHPTILNPKEDLMELRHCDRPFKRSAPWSELNALSRNPTRGSQTHTQKKETRFRDPGTHLTSASHAGSLYRPYLDPREPLFVGFLIMTSSDRSLNKVGSLGSR